MKLRLSVVLSWMLWGAILIGVVATLATMRSTIDTAHVVLVLLLVVVGGSVAGGRLLGFTLALASTELIDFYFQAPYEVLSMPKPLDLVVLLTFCVTAFVTTELLAGAREQAATAQARAREIETLSRLGADTLRHASSREALDALSALVCDEVDADECVILRSNESVPPEFNAVEVRAADLNNGSAVPLRAGAVALPLLAEDRRVGTLLVRKRNGLSLDAPRKRLLAALSYYAAVGVERERLMSEAAYSEALRESQRAKDEVFAAVSHDLRTPLTTIKVLAQGYADRGERNALAIVEQADRLARLVTDMLMVSRFRAGNMPLSPELNTAEDLIGAVLRQMEGVREGKTITVHIDYESPVLVGQFDFVHTLRILGNLLGNALRHSGPGGEVELRAEREGNMLVFVVGDRGPGVATEERERIFEPFYRPAGSARDAGHVGLGLSIARSLAEQQGGTVEYAPRPGGGSLFTLRLPAADVADLAASELS